MQGTVHEPAQPAAAWTRTADSLAAAAQQQHQACNPSTGSSSEPQDLPAMAQVWSEQQHQHQQHLGLQAEGVQPPAVHAQPEQQQLVCKLSTGTSSRPQSLPAEVQEAAAQNSAKQQHQHWKQGDLHAQGRHTSAVHAQPDEQQQQASSIAAGESCVEAAALQADEQPYSPAGSQVPTQLDVATDSIKQVGGAPSASTAQIPG